MSPRRVYALVNGLPVDAAVWRDGRRWTWERELAATLVEAVDAWGRANVLVQGADGSKLPPPLLINRPGEPDQPAEPRQVETDPQKILKFFSQ